MPSTFSSLLLEDRERDAADREDEDKNEEVGDKGVHEDADEDKYTQCGTDGCRSSRRVPTLNGYQIIGDSIASRLTQYCSPPLKAEYNHYLKSKQVGFIVHGQTTCQLARHLNQATFEWCDAKAAVLIGTNDILKVKNVPLEDTKKGLKNIISFLAINTKSLIMMTIPPIPRNGEHSEKVQELNKFIVQEAAEKENVHVLDLYSKFLKIDESIELDLFEKTLKSGMVDLIHPNKNGIESIKNELIEMTAKLSFKS
ncbi:N-acylneuraminate cytidylyltransferase [Frankliniella fusca]|uniref:N-acylneuraminate cytidylyltransferase n=1 Tax=Frankliniella fusca TaxID=407009 RepID=A0AAE1LH47_9NEOP|nr:N-acylneuraminate cytidylyltransferase [Frankliniella fusca]